MIDIDFSLNITPAVPNTVNHVDRIIRFYKRAVLDSSEKSWAHSTLIMHHVRNFTLIPLKVNFYLDSPLCEDPMARFHMLKDVAARSPHIDPNRLNEFMDHIQECVNRADWVLMLDYLDDLEDLLYEPDEERRVIEAYSRHCFFNRNQFLSLQRVFLDSSFSDIAEKLNSCGRKLFHIKSMLVNPTQCERALKQAERALNRPNFDKVDCQLKVDRVVMLIEAGYTSKSISGYVKRATRRVKGTSLTIDQEDKLLKDISSKPENFDTARLTYRMIERISGRNILESERTLKLYFNFSHWSQMFDRIEAVVDFAQIGLPEAIEGEMYQLSKALIRTPKDNQRLDVLLSGIVTKLFDIEELTGKVNDKYFWYLKRLDRDIRKIRSIDHELKQKNLLNSSFRVVNLN